MAESQQDPYEGLRKFRTTERAQMIGAIRELIEEAQMRVKSNYTLSRERAKWMRLAGQLIWYKDQILRSLSYEAMEKEVDELKKIVTRQFPPPSPSPSISRRTIRGRRNSRKLTRGQRPTPTASGTGQK